MSSKIFSQQPETFEWIVWFSELPARVTWQMVKDALKIRVTRGIRNVRYGGPHFISADVGSSANGKHLFDEIKRTGIEGLENCSFTIAWGYIVRGQKVYSVKFEEQKYIPPRNRKTAPQVSMTHQHVPTTQRDDLSDERQPLVHPHIQPAFPDSTRLPQTLAIGETSLVVASRSAEYPPSAYADAASRQVDANMRRKVQFTHAGDARSTTNSLHDHRSDGRFLHGHYNSLLPSDIGAAGHARISGKATAASNLEAPRQARTKKKLSRTHQTIDVAHSRQQVPTVRAKPLEVHDNLTTPVTDAEGRSIVGSIYNQGKFRRRIASEKYSTSDSDSDSENDMTCWLDQKTAS